MFGLISGLWSVWHRKREFQLLIVGLDNAGKTTCLEQWKRIFHKDPNRDKNMSMSTTVPTVGLNLLQLDVEGCNLIIWDLGGQSGLRVIWNRYYSDAHAIIYVIDASDTSRIDEARMELEAILAHKDLSDAPLLVLANKQDLDKALSAANITSRLGLHEDRLIRVCEVSALTSDGLADSLKWILEELPECDRTHRMNDEAPGGS